MGTYLDLAIFKPVAFGIESGFEDLGDIHNDWIKKFLYNEEDMTLQAHRGSYKTTSLAIAMALMIILFPAKNMIFLRKGDNDVMEIITQVAKMLENDIFQELSRELYEEPIQFTRRSSYEIDTNLKATSRGAPQLLGIGSKSTLTGKHGDIIITDDIININDRISRAHRERTKYTYQELENVKNRGGRFVNTGTPWHDDDAFQLMPNLEKYDCYSTGMMTDQDIEHLKDKMSPSLFAANYELKHIADGEALFTNPVIDDGSNTDKIFDGLAHIDAAYGGNDQSAFTVAKRASNGLIYVYGSLKEKHIDDVLSDFETKRKIYRAGTLYNETNADKGYLAKKIEEPVKTYHEKMNKYIKISTYLRAEWSNIVFVKDTDPEYINQVLDFNENATNDDAPDSLASLIRIMNSKKIEQNTNKEDVVGFLRLHGL